MGADVLVPAMFISLMAALLAGFPVAFSIAAVAALFGIVGLLTGHFEPAFLLAMRFRIEEFFRNENFLSIPLFLFMGMLLERTHIAEDMLRALDRLMGGVRGGMAYAAVLVGACIAAITGFVSAAVIAIALVALPTMLKSGYDPKLAAGVVAASGTLAQILPPSIVLIVLAVQLDVPLLDIYRGALLPSTGAAACWTSSLKDWYGSATAGEICRHQTLIDRLTVRYPARDWLGRLPSAGSTSAHAGPSVGVTVKPA